MATIPVIASAADIDQAIVYAHRRPEARWYVARRAAALGAGEKIPGAWGLTAAGPSQAVRDKAADKGEALPDGSFPIRNKSDLEKAVKAYGRAKDKAKAKRHIIKRARALKATDALPESWGVTASALVAASIRGVARKIRWDPALHPRGRDGRFIEKGGSVSIFEGAGFRTPEARGRAVGVRREGDNELVQVEITKAPSGGEYEIGDTVEVDTENLEAGPEEKARLTPNPPPHAEPLHEDVDQEQFDAVLDELRDSGVDLGSEELEEEIARQIRQHPDWSVSEIASEVRDNRGGDVDEFAEDDDEITPQDEMLSDEADTGIGNATDWQNAAYDELQRRGVSDTSIDDFFARAQPSPEEAFESGEDVESWVDQNMESLEEDVEYEGDESSFIDSVRDRLDEMGVQYDLEGVDADITELYRSTNDPDVEEVAQDIAGRSEGPGGPDASTVPATPTEPRKVYHVTSPAARELIERDGFRSTGENGAFFGQGVYFHTEKEHSDQYLEDWQTWMDPDAEQMMAVAEVNNPFVVQTEYNPPDPDVDDLAVEPRPREAMWQAMRDAGLIGQGDRPSPQEITQTLQNAGYDGVEVRHHGAYDNDTTGSQLVVFDREKAQAISRVQAGESDAADPPSSEPEEEIVESPSSASPETSSYVREGEDAGVFWPGFPAAPVAGGNSLFLERWAEEMRQKRGDRAYLKKELKNWESTKRQDDLLDPEMNDPIHRQMQWRTDLLQQLIDESPPPKNSTKGTLDGIPLNGLDGEPGGGLSSFVMRMRRSRDSWEPQLAQVVQRKAEYPEGSRQRQELEWQEEWLGRAMRGELPDQDRSPAFAAPVTPATPSAPADGGPPSAPRAVPEAPAGATPEVAWPGENTEQAQRYMDAIQRTMATTQSVNRLRTLLRQHRLDMEVEQPQPGTFEYESAQWYEQYLQALIRQRQRGTTASGAEDPREALRRRVHGG